MNPILRLVSSAGICSSLFLGAVHAAPLVDGVKLIADTTAAARAAPAPHTFAVTTAGVYTVKLTDLSPAGALSALSIALSNSTATVAVLSGPGGVVTMNVTLAAGNYTVQPLVTVAAGKAGSFTVSVSLQGSTTPTFVGPWAVIAPAASSPPGQSVLATQFTSTDSGAYQLTVTDRAFPAALSDLKLRVSLPDGTSLPCTVTLPAPTCNLSLTSGVTYDLFVIAAADTTALEGLYSLKIAGISPLTSVPYAATIPVGGLSQSLNAVVLSAGNISLRFNDLNYPAALAAMKALVTQNGEVLQQFTTAGNAAAVPVVAGTVQIFASAAPDAARGEGAYAVYVSDNAGATLLDTAVPVVDSTHLGYSFSKPLSAAGSYQFIVTDYLLPKPIAVLDAFAEQQGGVLGSGVGANIFVSAQNGPLNMIAFAAVPAAGDSGLFGIDLLGPGSGGTVFQTTQGVGALLQTVDIVAVAGKYVAQLTDLGFPANFGQLRLIGTGNRQVLTQLAIDQQSRTGKVVFDVPSAGAYVINVLAQVGSGEHYGFYGFTLATAPPAPVVTLTSSLSTVNAGEHATLTWTSTDAAGCTASDGWSGTLAATGSKDVGALSATTTFTISCTGDGGTGMASALVRVTQPMSGGGGGAMNSAALATLALASIWIVRRR